MHDTRGSYHTHTNAKLKAGQFLGLVGNRLFDLQVDGFIAKQFSIK